MLDSFDEKGSLGELSKRSFASEDSLADLRMTFDDLTDQQRQAVVDSIDIIVAMSNRSAVITETLGALWQVDHRAGLLHFVRHGKYLASDMLALATVYDELRSKLPEYDGSTTSPKEDYDPKVASLFPAVIHRFNVATGKFSHFGTEAGTPSEETALDDGVTLVKGMLENGTKVEDLTNLLRHEAKWLRSCAERLEHYHASGWEPDYPASELLFPTPSESPAQDMLFPASSTSITKSRWRGSGALKRLVTSCFTGK